MSHPTKYRLSAPLHLQVRSASRRGRIMSVREHLPPEAAEDPALPLVVITYHPGFAAGSYEDRDYFELLSPLLFAQCRGCCRLRIFTLNHPGYDLPPSYKVKRFDMAAYSIREQPMVIDQVLRWLLLRHFAKEEDLFLLAYGHSMGGLALAKTDLNPLQQIVSSQGRRVRLQKVLSAPALVLHENARKNLRQLNALKAIKYTVGRMPLYERIAQTLFRTFAPLLYRRDAEAYSLNPDCTFLDFPRYNPFVLLEQGLELLQLDFSPDDLIDLLDGSHLILSSEDGMVDSTALHHNVEYAVENGASVNIHTVDSSHNAERDDPQLIADAMCAIMRPFVTASHYATLSPAAVP